MSGVRIYELARELGVKNKVLIDLLGGMGYPVKSHSSSIEHHLADRLRRQVDVQGLEVKKKPAAKKKAAAKPAAKKKPAAKPAEAKKPVKPAAAKKPGPKPAEVKKPEPKPKPKEREAVAKPVEAKKTTKPAAAKKPEPKPAEVKKPEPKPKPKEREAGRKATEDELNQKELEGRKREEERKKKQQELREKQRIEDQKRRDIEKKRRAEREKQRKEEEKKNKEREKLRKEEEKKRRAKEQEDAKIRQEELEIQRLIDEEERIKSEAESLRVIIDEATTVKEFSEIVKMGVNEIIQQLMGKGIMATLNQTIDVDVARELAVELGFEIKTREEKELEVEEEEEEEKESLRARPPVVTIMGHVDHGKTSLLDTIRKTRVTEQEAGGITQRIGAYKVEHEKGTIVFVDTPGHEAFTAMRARGASVTDLVILVVAADDGVMPQTLEAIHHAKAAKVPVVVAVNKIDKPGANPDKIKQDLASNDVVPEEWGGSTIFCEVSAKENIGIETLLEMVLLQAEVLELKANPSRSAYGVVIESKLDKGRGPVATVLIQKGTLQVSDNFVTGVHYGKVRAILDDRGSRLEGAGPAIPVEVLGCSGVPAAGESFMVVESERKAHQIAAKRQEQMRIEGLQAKAHVSLETLHAQITKGTVRDLNLIIKADVQGSIEAMRQALGDIKLEDLRINILHGAVGGITETDISLAAASNAIVIGFNVRPTEKATALAESEEVDVRLYSVIYHAVNDVKSALEGMLEPETREVVTGRAEVRDTFHITKVGTIAGCSVLSGKITRNAVARIIRDNVVAYNGKINSLKRFKDDAKEVAQGYECGIGIEKYNDIKVGDVIETFEIEVLERKKL